LEHFLRKALPSEAEIIWNILQQAIERRRKDGSRQWQDGYPNLEVVKMDISSITKFSSCPKDTRWKPCWAEPSGAFNSFFKHYGFIV